MKEADVIRHHVVSTRIEPLRRNGSQARVSVTIRSIEIAKELKLEDHMPNVCGALDAKKFLEDNGIQLVSRTGPKQGRTVVWVFLV